MTTAFVGLGSNIGDRVETLATAVWVLDEFDDTTVEDVSGLYETEPWGGVEQEPFLNAVARLTTSLSPLELLDELQATEAAMGRDRSTEERWGPRTLDLDLLLYGDEVVDTDRLVVPHPRLVERAFVVVPLMGVFPVGAAGRHPPDPRRAGAGSDHGDRPAHASGGASRWQPPATPRGPGGAGFTIGRRPTAART